MSNSVRPHGQQPTRLLCPQDSLGKNTGVGCHLLLQDNHVEPPNRPWSKWVTQLCPTLCDPMDYTVHGILQARILEWVAFPLFRRSSQPRNQTQVSHIAGGFFTRWATGKPKNTRVGSLSLLQQIFPIQELNRGLLLCRQILYQPSYQESLFISFIAPITISI